MPRRPATHDPSLPVIARNLRVIRAELKMKQLDAEQEARVPRGQLSRWEKGHKKPEVDSLVRLAAVYGCSVDDLVADVYPPYDRLVEDGLDADCRRHYEGTIARLEKAYAHVLRLLAAGHLAHAPHSAPPAAEVPTPAGKSPAARAQEKTKRKKT